MKIKKIINKRGQEEMVGFALIIIIVAVILLVFLAISLNKSKAESLGENKVNSFIQSFLAYTTDCMEDQDNYYSIQNLIKDCVKYDSLCLDERKTCDVLNSTLEELVDESWPVGENTPTLGYELIITTENKPLIEITKGNITNNYKGSPIQEFSFGGESVFIEFSAYY